MKKKLLLLFKKIWDGGLGSDDPVSIFVGWDIYRKEGRHKNARIQGKWISYKDGIFMSHSIISCQTFRVRLRTSTLHRNVLSYTSLPETDFFSANHKLICSWDYRAVLWMVEGRNFCNRYSGLWSQEIAGNFFVVCCFQFRAK